MYHNAMLRDMRVRWPFQVSLIFVVESVLIGNPDTKLTNYIRTLNLITLRGKRVRRWVRMHIKAKK